MRTTLAALVCALPLVAQAQVASVSGPASAAEAREAIAARVADRLLPPGAFTTLMRTTMDQMSGAMFDQAMSEISLADIARISGADEQKVAKLAAVNLKEMMAILDPAYEERTRITMKVMADEMVVIMTGLEPEYRAGLGEALAARFTVEQLRELDRFFATPTGSAYAGQSMTVYVDPAMMKRMEAIMPRVMKTMPAIMQKAVAATAHLPRGDYKDLSSDQKARLAALFGEDDDK